MIKKRIYDKEYHRMHREATALLFPNKMRDYMRKKRARRLGVIRPVETVCAICNRIIGEGNMNMDHDHKTGLFRGWVCHYCNTRLGWFENHRDIILRYLLC